MNMTLTCKQLRHQRSIKKSLIFSLLILLSCTFSGCTGFSYSLKGGSVPGKTFSIDNFENIAPLGSPGISIWIQDLLRDRLIKETSLKYVPENGDAHFQGTIVSYTISPVLGTGGTTVDLNRLTVGLKVTYTNSVDEKNDFAETFTNFDDFKSSEDISTQEEELISSIGNQIVNKVFNKVLADW